MKNHNNRIAVIPGDGIGKEVMPEAIEILHSVAKRFEIGLEFDQFEFIIKEIKKLDI